MPWPRAAWLPSPFSKEGRLRLIESGLRPEEWIITGGVDELRPGERVAPRRPGGKE